MKWPFLLILIFASFHFCVAQVNLNNDSSSTEWIWDNTSTVLSIDPENIDFEDLENLQTLLSDVRVVALGEPSHNDGGVFLAKTRLIKFLHQEMGFNVLAFENDFYALDKAWQKVRNGNDASLEIRKNLYWMWGESKQVKPLLDYIDQSKYLNPLIVTGFDFRVTALANSKEHFLVELDSVLSMLSRSYIHSKRYVKFKKDFAQIMEKEYLHGLSHHDEIQLLNEIRSIKELFIRRKSTEIIKPIGIGFNYWFQLVSNIEVFCKNAFSYTFENGGKLLNKYGNKNGNLRDKQMGENAIWLVNHRFPKEKVILWGATYHFCRNLNRTDSIDMGGDYSKKKTMGDVLWKVLEDDMFTIGFTAYRGKKGNQYEGNSDIGVASQGSMEYLLKDFQYAFLAFPEFRNNPNSPTNIEMRLLGYLGKKSNWADHLDAIFFINDMTPSSGY